MNIGEDVRISLRSIQKRPVESLLLIIGIALGIGATAAGVSLISHSIKAKNELLSHTSYKEVVVRVRESAEDMDLAAMPKLGDGNVYLSWVDLAAKNDVPDVQHAYVADKATFRIITTATLSSFAGAGAGASMHGGQGVGQGGAASGSGAGQPPPPPADGDIVIVPAPSREDGERSGAGAGGSQDAPTGAQEGFSFQMPELPDGPEPVIGDMPGMRVSMEYFPAWGLQAAEGSLFTQTEMEENAPVMVLGSELAATLFEDGLSLGREVLIMRNLYRVVGILETSGTVADETAFIPARLVNMDRIPEFARQFVGLNTTLHFTVFDPDRLDEAKAQLTLWFSQLYGDGQVVISIPRTEVEAAQDRTARLVSVILFLAVAGLLIASVNVSNILLGRAMRKRKNVGILKALGASIRDVFGLFFIEALILGVSGAVLGAGLSVLISRLMLVAIPGGAVLSIALFLGVLAAWAVTTSLTVIPALQASRIPAAEALRYE